MKKCIPYKISILTTSQKPYCIQIQWSSHLWNPRMAPDYPSNIKIKLRIIDYGLLRTSNDKKIILSSYLICVRAYLMVKTRTPMTPPISYFTPTTDWSSLWFEKKEPDQLFIILKIIYLIYLLSSLQAPLKFQKIMQVEGLGLINHSTVKLKILYVHTKAADFH